MKKLRRLSGLVLIIALSLSACKKKDNNEKVQPAANEIWMENLAFVPSTKVVDFGTTVTWINKDDVRHTVTSDEGLFDSGNIMPDSTFTYTFDSIGTRSYRCTIHPGMTGVVIVE